VKIGRQVAVSHIRTKTRYTAHRHNCRHSTSVDIYSTVSAVINYLHEKGYIICARADKN